jgi:hypothetical protein
MKNQEIFLPINDPFFEDYYEVSNTGKIRSVERVTITKSLQRRVVPSKILNPRNNKIHPHLFVELSVTIDCVLYRKTVYIHKAVAECFLKKDFKKQIFVTHKDGDYNNNNVSNLKWITASENSKRSMELYPENRNTLKNHNVKIGYYESLKSLAIKNPAKILKKYHKEKKSVKEIAKEYNCSTATIYNVLNFKYE